jgi:hypothetical protein
MLLLLVLRRVGPVIAQEIDQWQLPRHSKADRSAPASRMTFGDRNNIAWQSAMTNRIFGNELQQRRVAKIVCTFENDPLTRQILMLFYVSPSSLEIHVHGQL